eukprot:5164340-Ditylum_brightwellii.AAC.1
MFPDHAFLLKDTSPDEIAQSFSKEGFILLSQVLDDLTLDEWKQFAEEYFHRCFQVLHENGHIKAPLHCIGKEYLMGLGAKYGFKEL